MRAREHGDERARETPGGVVAEVAAPMLLAPGALTRAAVLRLRRTAGNAAVARMLQPGRPSRVSIQRKGESAALLQKLAVPRVGEGQSIEVQKRWSRSSRNSSRKGSRPFPRAN